MSNEIMATFETAIVTDTHVNNLTNKKLIAHTKAIEKLMTATKRNMFEISARLLVIRNENLFTDDGFKDVFEYAEKLFGYKKNMVYKLTTAAEKFIEQAPEGKGYISILAHETEDYTVSQLIELNAIEPDTAVTLDRNEVINPKMTTKEIREVVKSYKNGEIDEEGNDTGKDEGEEVETDNEPTEEIDATEMAIMNAVNSIDTILADERIIADTVRVAKLHEIKSYLESIVL